MTKTDEDAALQAELEALAALPDDMIDTSDIPEMTDERWRSRVRGRNLYLARRLDNDVAIGSSRGDDYAAKLNHALRAYMAERQAVEPASERRSA